MDGSGLAGGDVQSGVNAVVHEAGRELGQLVEAVAGKRFDCVLVETADDVSRVFSLPQ